LCQFHPIQFVAGLTRISAYSRPCQAGFAGVWFRHEKPLRFRAIPPEPLQHGVEQKASKGTKKEFSALWSLF
jgi:hypothetical protein